MDYEKVDLFLYIAILLMLVLYSVYGLFRILRLEGRVWLLENPPLLQEIKELQ